MGDSLIVSDKKLVPFWEKKKDLDDSDKFLLKKVVFILKTIFYSFSGFMILWSFVQSFMGWVGYNPEPGHGLEFGYLKETDNVVFDLGSWSIAGPGYHAFYKPGVVFGPFLS